MKTKILVFMVIALSAALVDSVQEANTYKRIAETFYKRIMERNLEDAEIRSLLRDMSNLDSIL